MCYRKEMRKKKQSKEIREKSVNYHKLWICAGNRCYAEVTLWTSGGQQRTTQRAPLQLGLILLVTALQSRVGGFTTTWCPCCWNLQGRNNQIEMSLTNNALKNARYSKQFLVKEIKILILMENLESVQPQKLHNDYTFSRHFYWTVSVQMRRRRNYRVQSNSD